MCAYFCVYLGIVNLNYKIMSELNREELLRECQTQNDQYICSEYDKANLLALLVSNASEHIKMYYQPYDDGESILTFENSHFKNYHRMTIHTKIFINKKLHLHFELKDSSRNYDYAKSISEVFATEKKDISFNFKNLMFWK